MARIDTARPDPTASRAMNDSGLPSGAPGGSSIDPGAGPSPSPPVAAFRAGRGEAERTVDLLAFGMAAERGLAPTPDAIERARREADAALADHALRYLHNHVQELRQEAVAEHLGRLRPPPGFAQLVFASLVALAIAGGLGAWLTTSPEVRTALAGLLGG